jgi:tetratricopeptide (TPR) repeat protein/transcriptional regulator with XRE-family HTH domain
MQERGRIPNSRLVAERQKRGWTQADVADQIGAPNALTVQRWETGKTRPGPLYRRRLMKIFEKTEQELGLIDQSAFLSQPALFDPTIPLVERLTGREHMLISLQQHLLQPGPSQHALYGLPGVGKTLIAAALAHNSAIQQRYEGVLWVGVGPSPHVFELLSRWGRLLGLPPKEVEQNRGQEQWTLSLRTAIGRRAFLIVIDDAWTIETALTFLVGGPNCSYLLTSRSQDVAFLFAQEVTKVEELDEREALTLIKRLAPEIEQQEAIDLVRLVGGLPLALTLIGKHLHIQAQNGPPRRIQTALSRLQDTEKRLHLSMPLPFTNKTSSLDTAIQVSVEQLSHSARVALSALSVFPAKPNSFSEEAALVLCDEQSLDELVDAGLLEQRGSERYCLHQVISDYASQQQSDVSIYDQLITYYTDLVEVQTDHYEQLEHDSNNILTALESAYTRRKYAEFVRGVCAFVTFLQARGLYDSAELQLQRANRAAQANTDMAARCCILLYLGEIEQKRGNYARAEAYFQEGLALARDMSNSKQISKALASLGWVTWKQGAYHQAETYLQEGLSLAREANDRKQIAELLRVAGAVNFGLGNDEAAEAAFREGLALARQTNEQELICVSCINLGTALTQKDLSQAITCYSEGLERARSLGHYEWQSLALLNLTDALLFANKVEQAKQYAQEGIALAQRINHREYICSHKVNLGNIAREEREDAQAQTFFQEALTIAEELGRPYITSHCLYDYGCLLLSMHQVEAAEACFNEMSFSLSDPELVALRQYGMARIAAAHGDQAQARQLGEQSLVTLQRLGRGHLAKQVQDWLATLSASSCPCL